MKYIENEQFLHIQRATNGLSTPLWNKNESYFIGQKKNRYFEFFDYANVYFNPDNLDSVNTTLTHSLTINREFIFEEVRKEFFPSHPSRQKCLWVINSEDPNAFEYWKNTLGTSDKVLRVQLTGKIHKANPQYLNLTADNLNKVRQNAFHYWTGTRGDRPEEEILFEGFVNVLEELQM